MTDYTMQSSKGGFNPFLAMEADYSQPAPDAMYAPADNQSSNPFLTGFGAADPVEQAVMYQPQSVMPPGDNPFLSYGSYATNEVTASESKNPFADFADPAPLSQAYNASSAYVAPSYPPAATNAFFASGDYSQQSMYQEQAPIEEPMFGDELPPLIETAETAAAHMHTQALLESVTGALEATSDSLLDRLRVTAPSPTPEMPSPTPSPRSPSPDLLMGEEPPPPPPPSANPLNPSPHHFDSIIDLLDSAPPSGPRSTADILNLYNNTVTMTTAKPPVEVLEVASDFKPLVPVVPLQQESLVDLIIEPPTPKLFEQPQSEPEPMVIGSPVNAEMEAQPEKPQPPAVPDIAPPDPVKMPPIRPASPEPVRMPPVRPVSPEPVKMPPVIPASPKPPSPVVEVKMAEPIVSPEPVRPMAVPAAVAVSASPSRAAPPDRPKPPPPPVHETAKPSPSRPPPPVPPAPRSPHHPPPPVPAAPFPPQAAPQQETFQQPTPQPAFQPPPQPAFQPSPASTNIFQSNNIFAAPASQPSPFSSSESSVNKQGFNSGSSTTGVDIFGSTKPQTDAFSSSAPPPKVMLNSSPRTNGSDAFDAFEAKFASLSDAEVSGTGTSPAAFNDPFGGAGSATTASSGGDAAWGGTVSDGFGTDSSIGFGTEDTFDSFLSLTEPPPVPQSTPAKSQRGGDDEFDKDDEDKEMSIFIRPRNDNDYTLSIAPTLAPPPKSPAISTGSAYSEENNTAFVPFLSATSTVHDTTYADAARQTQMQRTDSSETPQTPLYEEDTSQPLEDFPRTKYTCEGWEMQIRLPNKKKITGNRFWKKVWVQLDKPNDIPIVHIYNNKGDKEPFQEIPLQSCYSCSDISAQQFDQYGKIFTMKIQYVFYKERPGVRPGQIGKASRLSTKLSAFAAYAMTGDYSGVKEFGSDLKKMGLPLEHAPQVSQLVKLGTQTFDDMKQFSMCIEEALFTLPAARDRALNYKTEEIQVTIVDEFYVEQDVLGVVTRQIARVRLFFLSFLNGVAEIEMGVNDLRRQGKEIVGRHDIIPVPTEEWIRMETIEFSNVVQLEEFESTQTIKFKPPDASYLELMRFRVRPPKHRELPLQIKTTFITTGQRIEIRSDILVPGFTSRKLGQIPCEDVMVRFPIPEAWIYMFRVEKHFRYGSVKSAHRRSGKVKGVERILGALDAVEPSLMETTSGQAKYEHQHRAIVWRIPRLPKEGQGAYTTHSFFCHITLQAHEKMPDNMSKHCHVEFTMPHTTVSHTVCRSISVPTSDDPPEKACRYISRHEYLVEIEYREGMAQASYSAAAAVIKEEPKPPPPEEKVVEKEFDSDFSDD